MCFKVDGLYGAALGVERRGLLVRYFQVTAGHVDYRALARKRLGYRITYAAGAGGDERHLVFKLLHYLPPVTVPRFPFGEPGYTDCTYFFSGRPFQSGRMWGITSRRR